MIKLLHVEDDEDIREITMLALALSGEFEVLQCDSGEEGLKAVDGFQPDVLLMDMMMPGMSGKEMLEFIREKPAFANTPAIFMTARAQHGEREALLETGAAAVISKPFDPTTLGEQVKAAMSKAKEG
ncbi:response regulator [Rhodobacteraceae bacterium D3-12]|nr:response regulator [Rhodobacteraceae bacterium D3-12]